MRKLVIANWKMNPPTLKKARELARKISIGVSSVRGVETIIAPPFVYIDALSKIKGVKLGAQDAFWEKKGAYTGEISAPMLKNLGVKYIIVGHSERRHFLGETDEMVARKTRLALEEKLTPVVCVGEHSRTDNSFHAFVKNQLLASLQSVPRREADGLVVVYEPVWAISSKGGAADDPKDILEMAIFVRKILHDAFGKKQASQIRVLYGGSVDGDNAEELAKQSGVDGFLVGGASLRPKEFVRIVRAVARGV